MTITSRSYEGPADLHALLGTITASWRFTRPLVNVTPGGVEWWFAVARSGIDWRERIRLWELDGEVVAWAFFEPPNELGNHLRVDLPADGRRAIVAEMLEWVAERALGQSEPPSSVFLHVLDADHALCDDLRALGLTPSEASAFSHFHTTLGAEPAAPVLPPGYRIRPVREDELAARVDLHRAAFTPSRMTVEKYRQLVTMPHYAFARDLVVEAPDGSLAAFTMVWWDPEARVGEFEPVGTHPDHRGKGLARAVNLAGLHLLRGLGALDVLVFSRTENAASEALYPSVGFQRLSVHRAWTRALGG
ncbi:GNAT family N-acetyltransferase [Polyangium aurulentum]|uniref:GNAT family N-acetyltransferase n=1 Tax=Polyangium aurulentum TaxID=2567896 RepID=UPI0010ADFEFB|nr:GNAT family N-acetyltransferase [Polyangium aurulentum]UQA58953.1 GNAT family N-acetyltransferase [Polyangium aurulentum]